MRMSNIQSVAEISSIARERRRRDHPIAVQISTFKLRTAWNRASVGGRRFGGVPCVTCRYKTLAYEAKVRNASEER